MCGDSQGRALARQHSILNSIIYLATFNHLIKKLLHLLATNQYLTHNITLNLCSAPIVSESGALALIAITEILAGDKCLL